MYNPYFHFSCSPFDNTLDQRFLFLSESHEEVISALLYFVKEKKSFALVCGDVGTGKTMMVHHLLEQLPRSVLPILIPYPDVEYIEILRYIARVLKIKAEGKGVLDLIDELKSALTKVIHGGRQAVLIIDEAHLLSTGNLENIRLLSNIELTQSKLLQILLIGQNELGLKLRKKGMRQLRQRINVNRVLSPMSPFETVEYVDHRLKIAESSFEECFDKSCMKLLYEMTGGVPRSINRLCDTALLVCMTEKGHKVTKKILRKAYDALNIDLIQAPAERPGSAFSYAFSYAKRFRPAFAATALTLVVAVGVLGLKDNLSERLRQWSSSPQTVQEVSADSARHQLPASEAKSQESPSPRSSGEDGSSIGLTGHEDEPALNSEPESRAVIPGEALTVKKIDEDVTADDMVSPGVAEAESPPPTLDETGYRTADNNFVLPQSYAVDSDQATAGEKGIGEDITQRPDKNQYAAQPDGEGADRVAGGERKTEEPVPRGPQTAEELPETSDFFMVTVKRGESLSRIAAQWFPGDPESGMKLILAANPSIHDQNLILPGQTIKVPKRRAAE